MNRRTFLKAIGLAIAAPGAVLGAVKPKGGIILPKYPSLGDESTTTCTTGYHPQLAIETLQKACAELRENHQQAYVLFVHPSQIEMARKLFPWDIVKVSVLKGDVKAVLMRRANIPVLWRPEEKNEDFLTISAE